MAVLVMAGDDGVAAQVVERLISQDDEVRVLQPTAAKREEWMQRGAFLAVGEADDPDLVERAAQNVRTIVILSERVTEEVVRTALEAGPKAGVDRLVCCASAIAGEVRELVRGAPMAHVLIESGRPGVLRRRTAPPVSVALAIDAADDLAGEPRLEVDLSDPAQLALLGL